MEESCASLDLCPYGAYYLVLCSYNLSLLHVILSLSLVHPETLLPIFLLTCTHPVQSGFPFILIFSRQSFIAFDWVYPVQSGFLFILRLSHQIFAFVILPSLVSCSSWDKYIANLCLYLSLSCPACWSWDSRSLQSYPLITIHLISLTCWAVLQIIFCSALLSWSLLVHFLGLFSFWAAVSNAQWVQSISLLC